MSTLFDIKKLVKEELIKLKEQAVVRIKLDDLSFDQVKDAFPKHYQKVTSNRRGVDGEQEEVYDKHVTFPNRTSRSGISSNSSLENWKKDFKQRYGNVEIQLDPQGKEWFNLVVVDDPRFIKDKEKHADMMSRRMSESVEKGKMKLKEHIKVLLENRKDRLIEIKEGVMSELDIIMDEASDFKDFLKRINRDSRLETSLLNSPDMIKFFTKMWKESGRSL